MNKRGALALALECAVLLLLVVHAQEEVSLEGARLGDPSPKGLQGEAQCLQHSTPSHELGRGRFDALNATGGGHAWSGWSCDQVKQHFGLCEVDPPPPRECLLARVPWRTPLSVVKCCFSCCMQHWQRELGMEEVYHTMRNISLISVANGDAKRQSVRSRLLKGLPPLDSVVLQEGSARRFSVARMSNGQRKPWIIPHERMLERGGVVVTSDGAGLTEYVSRNITQILKKYPVSIVNQGDIAWPQAMRHDDEVFRSRNGFSLFDLPRGGKTVTVNAHASLLAPHDNFLLSFWGVKSLHFEAMLGDQAVAEDGARPNQFMCCCMHDRTGRGIRAARMMKHGLCRDWGGHAGKLTMDQYIGKLASSRMVWSPAGHGLSTFRDLEVMAKNEFHPCRALVVDMLESNFTPK